MDLLMVLLRLVHVGLGALWVGMMAFTVFFLGPALQEAGPEGGKVMGSLQRRGMMTVLPLMAIGTILSGLWLYWRASGGFQPGYMRSPMGMALGLGGAASIIAWVAGIITLRPAMVRAAKLSQQLGSAPPQERAALAAELQRLRARSGTVSLVIASLLFFALGAMAVARYI